MTWRRDKRSISGEGVEEGTFTPTGTWSNTTYAARYEVRETEDGFLMGLQLVMGFSGTPSGSSGVTLSISPSGWEIDGTRVASIIQPFGWGFFQDASTGANRGPIMVARSGTALSLLYLSAASTMAIVTPSTPLSIASGDSFRASCWDVAVKRVA